MRFYCSLKIEKNEKKEGGYLMKNNLLLEDARHLFYGLVEGKYTTKDLEEEYNKLVNYHNEKYDTKIEEIKIKKGTRL